MFNIAIMVSGGGTNLQAVIDRIADGTIENARISLVISSKKNAYALERARRVNIPCRCISRADYESSDKLCRAMLDALAGAGADLIVLAGFLMVLPEQIVRAYRNRIINIHPSLIPSFCGTGYYGIRVHKEALRRGVKVTGATCHFVDEGTDTGPIILQKAVCVKEGDTAEVLQHRVMEEAEWVILPEAIRLIAEGRVHVRDGLAYIDEAAI